MPRLRARSSPGWDAALSRESKGESQGQVGPAEGGGDPRSQTDPMPCIVPHSESPEKRERFIGSLWILPHSLGRNGRNEVPRELSNKM